MDLRRIRLETEPGISIGLVEDDQIMGESICQGLGLEGFRVVWWHSGKEALAALPTARVRLLLLDIHLPDINGEALYAKLLPMIGNAPMIAITAYGRIEQAVRMIKMGVNDYLTKPFLMGALLERIHALLGSETGAYDTENLKAAASLLAQCPSKAMSRVVEVLNQVKDLDSTLLITGESGVGKELAAYYVHGAGNRATKPMVDVNCASIPGELFESELFGSEKGAFTGANKQTKGYMETAEDGILFLDEIGELPPAAQAKFLRVLEEKHFYRVGGRTKIPFRARVICSTLRDLGQMVEEHAFRADLYYRINVIQVAIPPLRKREEDITHLARHFANQFFQHMNKGACSISPEARHAMLEYEFPGNIRELKNRIERAVALCRGQVLGPHDIFPDRYPETGAENSPGLPPLQQHLGQVERDYILRSLVSHDWQISETSGYLQISRKTLWEKMKKYNISREEYAV